MPESIVASDPPVQEFAYFRSRQVLTSIYQAAPGVIRYPHVYLLPSYPQAAFVTDLFLPIETPIPGADGVRFTVRALDPAGDVLAEAAQHYDPSVTNGLIPLRLDLSAWRGQVIQLELATDPLADTVANDATWIVPRLVFSD